MKTISTLFFSASLFIATPAFAGSGHAHDEDGGHSHQSHGTISGDEAATRALMKVEQLVEKGKIPASWLGLTASSVEQKSYSQGPEWVVVFRNPQVSDSSKQALYIFFSLDGHYIAANYTGN